MHHQCQKNWLILTCTCPKLYRKQNKHRCFRSLIEPYFPLIFHGYYLQLFLPMAFDIGNMELRPGQWNMWRKIYGTRRAQSLNHSSEPCIRRPDETAIWVVWNAFILEGKSPEPWRHWYPTSQSPATYLTHKLTSFKARDWHGFVSKFGHHSSLSGWKWWNIE